ncbi:MAG: tail fiber domain-containing protein [Candidatus Aminicenantes bacterium]|jgi:hypothetical protein
MKQKLLKAAVMAFIVCFASMALVSAEGWSDKPVADVLMGSSGITWVPNVSYKSLVLTVARPDGTIFQKTFDSGSTPYIDLSNICGERLSNGSYTYELRVIPMNPQRVRQEVGAVMGVKGADLPHETLTQTGYFQVKDGMIVIPASTSEDGLSGAMDIVHADDVIIDGSLCVGNDCYSGLAFGFDTIVLMENNLRIFFDDTSTIQNYPRNDWRIICNDSTDGGGRYFAIEDATEVSNIFVLEAGAPDNSIYVDSYGDVGINTSTPYYELHIVDGDSPCVRLDQDGSYGWTPQKWDLCGNESNFFIRDATHASKLPFRIEPDAPTDSIFVKSNGNLGIGTGAPGYSLEVERTGTNAIIVAQRTSGATCKLGATFNQGQFGTVSNHNLKIVTNNATIVSVNTDGTLDMSDGGGYDGTWNPASSRELKENIEALTTDEAITAIEGLNPIKYNYKKSKEEARVGFIAEDVPDLVAMNGRKSLGTVDILAVLTKVVQEQQKLIRDQQETARQQQKIISELQKRIAEIEKK